jgi:hypothetical protein
VYCFGLGDLLGNALAKNGYERVFLGLIDFNGTTDATQKTIAATFHGKIMKTWGVPVIACTGSGGTTIVAPKIGGTALTGSPAGGGVTIATAASALGTNLAGQAITDDGTNEFHQGDAITLVASSSGGTRTAGLTEFWAECQVLPGA